MYAICVDLLITGHRWGELLIWHNPICLINDSIMPVCTRLHWHAQTVRSLSVSRDSTYVYSGGDEGVLVIWRVSNGEKTYLPRLGSAITSIASRLVFRYCSSTIRLVILVIYVSIYICYIAMKAY